MMSKNRMNSWCLLQARPPPGFFRLFRFESKAHQPWSHRSSHVKSSLNQRCREIELNVCCSQFNQRRTTVIRKNVRVGTSSRRPRTTTQKPPSTRTNHPPPLRTSYSCLIHHHPSPDEPQNTKPKRGTSESDLTPTPCIGRFYY